MRDIINYNLHELRSNKKELANLTHKLNAAKEAQATAERARAIMQQAAVLSQEHLASHLSGIVTQAIQAVIQKPYEFVCEFVERRGATEADMYLMKNGERYEILDSTGGGLADVCSFSLKVAYLLLSNMDNVLIIDEVSRHINSAEQRERFAEVLRKLSDEFKIQLIINTTFPQILAVADNVIKFDYRNEETVVL